LSQLQDTVPVIAPELASVSPVGREPDASAHVYGVVPPAADKVDEYACSVAPFGSALVVIVKLE
jgi:hypothetical protein